MPNKTPSPESADGLTGTSNIQEPTSSQEPSPKHQTGFDLVERTARFGEAAVKFANQVRRSPVTTPLVSQFVRSSTSVGANYMEANEASSGKDFQYKIATCRKEAKETMHWLRMLAAADFQLQDACRELWREAHEFVLIFAAIGKKRRP